MILVNVAQLFVKCLEQQDVKYIFGVPGEENIDFLDALHDSSIRFIVCRHETGAAFIAGIMGKLTGKPGVCLSTLGPGATNMMTGVACATLDRMPLVAITAQMDVPKQVKGTHQYLNLMDIYRPITKWNTSIQNSSILPKVVSEAFTSAVSDLQGAIHIELPNDIASLQVEPQPMLSALKQDKQKIMASESTLAEVARVINDAKFPLVLIGHRAADADETSAVRTFIETLRAPFTETFMAKGVVQGNHPCHLQTTGLPEGDFVNQAFALADLIVTIGYDPIEYGTDKWNMTATPILHINDQVPSKTDSFYPIKASLIGDIATNLECLTRYIQPREEMADSYLQLQETIKNDAEMNRTDDGFPLLPQRVIKEIRDFLSPDDILVSDVGAHKYWIGRQYDALKHNTCIISNGLASMGIGLPGAIGAKLAFPDNKVMAVCGDGAFNMSLAEFETAVRLKLPIVIMVWRDQRYSAIEWEQNNKLGRSTGIEFDNPDFQKLAETYGARGFKVKNASELGVVLQKAFSEDGPAVIECPIDYMENFRLSERLKNFKTASPV